MNLFRTILAVFCIGVITTCSILLVDHFAPRTRVADLTEDRIYTPAPGTVTIIQSVKSPIKLKLYYSREAARRGPDFLQRYSAHFLYTRDLLLEFERISGGKLTLEVIDPQSFEDEEAAIDFGLQRFQINEQDFFMFGLAAVTGFGKEKVIPFMDPERQRFLEYDVAKLIVDLMQREKTTVGVISSLPVLGSDMSPYMMQMMQMQGQTPEQPWLITQMLRETYDVKKAEPVDGVLPDDLDYLLVIHPKDLPPGTLFAIDQYVMGGGKLIVFQDPHAMVDQPQQNPMMGMQGPQSQSSDLNALLVKWGVTMDSDAIVVDRELAVTAQFQRNQAPSKMRPFIQLTDEQMNAAAVPVAQLQEVQYLFGGYLDTTGGEGDVEWLVRTSDVGNTWTPESPYALMSPDPETIDKETSDGTKPLNLAVMITGKLTTNFPDGVEIAPEPPPQQPGMPPQPPPPGEPIHVDPASTEVEDAMIAVIADVDMLADFIAFRGNFHGQSEVGDNVNLLLNLLEYMSGNTDLISIRNRGEYRRPFALIEELKDAQEKSSAEEQKKWQEKLEEAQDELQKQAEAIRSEEDLQIFGEAYLEKQAALKEQQEQSQREIRRLKAETRMAGSSVKFNLELRNYLVVLLPALIACILYLVRFIRARQYVARSS
jgi:ABC-type uncharacterized transport system involved in gliding motility auxiliary subunit